MIKNIKQYTILLLLSIGISHCYNANSETIDSLETALISTNEDTARFTLYNKLVVELTYVDLDKAIFYNEKAEEIALKLDNDYQTSQVYIYYGLIYAAKRQNYKALKYMLQALDIAEENEKHTSVANACRGIVAIYTNLEEYDKALAYSVRSIDALEKTKQTIDEAVYLERKALLLSYMGKAYLNLNRLDEAILTLSESRNIFSEIDNDYYLAYLNNFFGTYFMKKSALDSAQSQFEEGIKNALKVKNKGWELTNKLGLAKVLYKSQQFDRSKKTFIEVIELSQNIKIQLYVTEAYESLANIYAREKNYKKAFETHSIFKQYSDSINRNNNKAEVARLEEKIRFEGEQELRTKEQKLKEYRLTLTFMILGALIIFLVLIFIIQRLKTKKKILEKKQLKNELLYKNSELTSKVMYKLKQTQLIEDVTSKLIQLKSKLTKKNEAIINDIINDLKYAHDDNIWKEFEKRFISIHPNFYKKLHIDFPDLTPNEQKICAFIKMKLNTKEIAYFTQSQPNTVKVAKTRLRKKIKLTHTEQSLESFIEQY